MGFVSIEAPAGRHSALRRVHEVQQLSARLGDFVLALSDLGQKFANHGVDSGLLLRGDQARPVQDVVVYRQCDVFHELSSTVTHNQCNRRDKGQGSGRLSQFAALIALTIFCAASSRSSAGMTLSFEARKIFLPSSTLVPSSRTTSGAFRLTSFTAAITPSAMTSQRMMPPKMLTRIPFTFGSAVMILKAAVTFSLEAPPPTSRKFAGLSP